MRDSPSREGNAMSFKKVTISLFSWYVNLCLKQAEIKVHTFRSVLTVKIHIWIEYQLSNRH